MGGERERERDERQQRRGGSGEGRASRVQDIQPSGREMKGRRGYERGR